MSIKDVLAAHYQKIVAIFTFYAGQSYTYPAMAIEDFTVFAQEAGLLGILSEATLMKCFTETIVGSTNQKQNGEKSLIRFEFFEILVRIAFAIQKETGQKSLSVILSNLLTGNVLVKAQSTDKAAFRRMMVEDEKVQELLSQNSNVLRGAFEFFVHEKKRSVSLEECVAFSRHC